MHLHYQISLLIGLSLILTFSPQTSQAVYYSNATMTQLLGVTPGNKLGVQVASGDVNGDGYAELISGAPNTGSAPAYVSIVYGSETEVSSATLSTSNSTLLTSETTDKFGGALGVGDVNGDGYADVVIGAQADTTAGSEAGAMYVIYGQPESLTSGQVSSMPSIPKFIAPNFGYKLGSAVAVGDVNGDGYDDIVVGASNHPTSGAGSGGFFIIPGSATAYSGSSNTLTGYAEFIAETAQDSLGSALAIGDLNGDGFEDIVAGASGNDDAGIGAGAIYVVYGQATAFSGSTSVSTLPQWTGEAADDAAGSVIAMSSGNLLGSDGLELLVGAQGSDNGATNAGAVYVIPGGTIWSGTSSLSEAYEIPSGASANENVPSSLASADLDQNGYDELLLGTGLGSGGSGATAFLPGGETEIDQSDPSFFTGTSTEFFGKSVATGDLNGDGFVELLVGASLHQTDLGAVYVGYLYYDQDKDGLPSSDGLLYDTSVLRDSDDTIPNNGVEVDGDEIDNDQDGEVDEHNTLSGNGEHPYYSTLDPQDTTDDQILSVTGKKKGKISVTYGDNSVYQYTIFDTQTKQQTKVKQYLSTGYAVAIDKKGKKAVLINLLTGALADQLKVSTKAWDDIHLLAVDVRKDGKTEMVVTSQLHDQLQVSLMKVKSATGMLKLLDIVKLIDPQVDVSKTTIKTNNILLRTSKKAVRITLPVKKNYTFGAVQ